MLGSFERLGECYDGFSSTFAINVCDETGEGEYCNMFASDGLH